MLKNYDDLSPVAIDCLREIGNIGSGSAASSLSEMLGKTIEMKVPNVCVLEYQQIIDAIIEDRIVRAKFADYGMTLSDEEEADIHSQVESGIESIKTTLKSTLASADDTLTDEELTAQAE